MRNETSRAQARPLNGFDGIMAKTSTKRAERKTPKPGDRLTLPDGGDISISRVTVINTGELPAPDAKAIRKAMGMGQDEFSTYFGMPIATVRNAEQGRTEMSGAMKALYVILGHEPEAAKRAFRKARTMSVEE